MTDDEYEISEEPPRDDQGHPVHPERGHRICAGTKSDRTTPTDHGRERDDYDYCLQPAGWGVDDRSVGPCKHHPVSGEQWGESNPNYKTGAYSEFHDFLLDGMPDDHRTAVEALDFEENGEDAAADVVRDLLARYQRTRNEAFLREARQWAKEFGVLETAVEKHEHEHTGEGGGPLEVVINREHYDSDE